MDIITLAESPATCPSSVTVSVLLALALVWASSSARPWNPPLVSLRCPGKIQTIMFIGLALVEVLALIGFVAALII